MAETLKKPPAAQEGHNANSIAICLTGDKIFSNEQIESLTNLCNEIAIAYKNKILFYGHCEVNKFKTCPNFQYKYILHLENNKIPDI